MHESFDQARTYSPLSFVQVLLHELLAFQIPDRRSLHVRPPAPESPEVRSKFIGFTASALRAFSHPSLQHLEPIPTLEPVPMNMGENRLPTPTPVKRFAFESFARQNISEAESDPRPEILEILQQRLGARPERAYEVHLGDGVAPLVARLLAACAEEGGTLLYPRWAADWFVTAVISRYYHSHSQSISAQQQRGGGGRNASVPRWSSVGDC